MNPCETFQAQLLNHLYGLLDDEDSRPLVDHLSRCPACQAALAAAEGQRRLLAAAAREEFAAVSFQAPAQTTPAVGAEAKKPAPSRPAPVLPVWGRWAIAAGLLLTVGGVGAWTWKGYSDLRARANLAQAEQDRRAGRRSTLKGEQVSAQQRTQARIRAIQEEIQRLETNRKRSRLQVRITGPETIEAGARNQFLVHTDNLADEPVSARVSVRVREQKKNQVVFRKDLRSIKGKCQVVLPPDLKQPPGARFDLEVVVRGDNGGAVRVDARNLHLVAPLYLSHLTTDKPMYQPGEVVYFRSLTLERFSLKPVEKDLQLTYRITDSNGAEVFSVQGPNRLMYGPERGHAPVLGPDNQPVRGLGTGSYPIPATAAGGVYTLTLTEAGSPYPLQQRKFLVNRYEKPRLNKQLEFTRKSYGPGEEVVAACRVTRVEGGKTLANEEVRATVQVDGKTYDASGKAVKGSDSGLTLRTAADGTVAVRFKLPSKIDRGEASLAVRFTDGASYETMVRSIPVVLKKLQVEFFPEGGDLVAGVRNRVYFQARTTLGKPAELKGRILDAAGKVVARVETLNDDKEPGANQGMGLFELVKPEAGKRYRLHVDSPRGIEGTYSLPEVKADGVVLTIPGGVITDNIPVKLHNGKTRRRLLVGAYCRGRLLDHTTVTARANEEVAVELKPQVGVGGVYRVTVFEELEGGDNRLKPVAERLIFRQPTRRVDLAIKLDKGRYTPGERVRLSLNSTDEKKQPLPAILMVAVVDKSVLTLADDKTARAMPTHFYLTTEVRGPEDLEYADFLLSNHPKAALALDLLLGTQGWRRFAEQKDPRAFQQKQKQDAERLLVVSGRKPQEKGRFVQPEPAAPDDKFQSKIARLQRKRTEVAAAEVRQEQERWQKIGQAEAALWQSREDAARAEAEVDQYRHTARTTWLIVLGVLLGFAGIGALVIGLTRVAQQLSHGVRYYAVGLCSLVLCVTAVGLVFYFRLQAPAGGAGDMQARRGNERNKDKGMDRLAAAKAAPMPPPPMAAPDMDKAEAQEADQKKEGLKMPPAEARGEEKGEGAARAAKKDAPAAPQRVPQVNRAVVARRLALGEKGAKPEPQADAQRKAALRGMVPPRDLKAKKRPLGRDQAPANARGGAARAKQDRESPKDKEDRALALPFVVREYAHGPKFDQGNARSDFAETLYWHPVLVLAGGKGEAAFHLCDSVTTFQVVAYAHTLDGRLGAATAEVQSRLPFTLEPKVPIAVTASDKITIPLAVANSTDQKRAVTVQVEARGLKNLGAGETRLEVEAEKAVRRLFQFQPSIIEGRASVLFKGLCEPFAQDSIERTFQVVPDGFPQGDFRSGLLERSASEEITLPNTWLKGTLKLQVQVYPSTLADLQQGLEALLREPNGCFEQSSTSNYPNVLILNYLKESDQAKPALVRRAQQLLDSGYQRLTSFECLTPADQKKRGYEWFGGTAPPHEALTAYGLLQFRDMARVYPVDKAMLERTRHYLMLQKDGQSGFKRNPRALDSFGSAPQHITNAYIVWALTESGKEDKVAKELAALVVQAKTSRDPYFLALVANSLFNRGRRADGLTVLKVLARLQKEDGHLDGAETSITHSGGRDLQIETTALTVLAWLKANRPDFTTNLQKAVKWIGQQRGGFGGFGSTQSTILALKALIAYTRANKKTAEAGELVLYVNNKEIERQAFRAGVQDVLTLSVTRPDKALDPGKNKVRVAISGKNVFPYTLSWSYRTLHPASAAGCPVELSTRLDRVSAAEADTVRLTAAVANKSGKGQGMTVAIIGLPAGLTLPEDLKQLKDYVRPRDKNIKAGEAGSYLSAFETRGRELILYWRDLGPDEKIQVNLDLICRVPGEYHGPASRAYLYYNADRKYWDRPLAVTITPRAEK